MGIYTIEKGIRKKRSKFWRLTAGIPLGIVAFGLYSAYQHLQPSQTLSKPVTAQSSLETVPTAVRFKEPLPWPNYGQSAYGVVNSGVLATSNDNEKPVPTASMAKVITALAVLKKKPLKPGEQGPKITFTQEDIDNYSRFVAENGSVVPIELGEEITEYQALQAMLMASANNISDSLVRWAFGSTEAYTVYANTMVNELGLYNTSVADASGFSPATVSTATDMVKLGILYMQNPLLKDLATQTQATIPFAGVISNYNSVLNKDGIIGIKVGDTDAAGRCFLVADMRGNNITSVAVVFGAMDQNSATKDAVALIQAGNASYDKLNKL